MRRLVLDAYDRLGPRSRYAAAALLGQTLYAAIGFLGSVVAARLLGVDGKGEYTAWTVAAGFFVLVLAGPIPVGLGRLHLRARVTRVPRALLTHGLGVLVAAGIGAATGLAFGLSAFALAACVVLAVPAGVVTYNALVLLQAAKRPWSYHIVRILQPSVITGGLLIAAVLGSSNPLHLAFLLFALGALTSAGLALAFVGRLFAGAVEATVRRAAHLGRGSTAANVIDFMALRADQFVVVAVAGPAGLGIYSVAVNWSEIGLYIGNSIGQAVFEDRDTLDGAAAARILRRAQTLLTAAVAVIAALGWLLIAPIFGDPFEDARWVLLLLAPGVVARGLAYTSAQILLARGRGSFVSRVMAVTVSIGLGVSVAATYVAGIEGAAAVSTALYFVQMLAMGQAARR